MINFKEHTIGGYPARTKFNATADCTIAIACDFNTAGEVCTHNAVTRAGKHYMAYALSGNMLIGSSAVNSIVHTFNKYKVQSLNIAGNGLYTLHKYGYDQRKIDYLVYRMLEDVTSHPGLNQPLILITTGGQTGVDEAGAKAGDTLGIYTQVIAPKGWIFRGIDNKDIKDEALFKARFP